MKPFDYLIADNLDAALAEYGEGGSTLKAGGFDLLDLMKERIAEPDTVLTIDRIEGLNEVREEAGGVHLGPLITLADIGRHPLLSSQYRALAETAGHAATPQVRERATLGGNLCQRPRCWYFRNIEFNCLKKGGATCFAVEGENRYHAIFGDGPCHIVHPSNTAPALVALDALLTLRTASEERQVPAREFFVMPAENLRKENVLREGEIITDIFIPKAPRTSATIELREKQSFDWPIAIASAARLEQGWQVALGAVAPVPLLSREAAEVLGDSEITEELATRAGEAAVRTATPLSDNAWRVQLARVAVKRALMAAAGMEVPYHG